MKLLDDHAEASARLVEKLEADVQRFWFFFLAASMHRIVPCFPRSCQIIALKHCGLRHTTV